MAERNAWLVLDIEGEPSGVNQVHHFKLDTDGLPVAAPDSERPDYLVPDVSVPLIKALRDAADAIEQSNR